MSRLPRFIPLQLNQIVRVTITHHPSGVLVARSADVPGRAAFASDMASLDTEIRDVIEGYFAQQGQRVRVSRSRGRNHNDLSTWEVETITEDGELLLAAE
jgi:hypothetical protein